MGYLEKIGTFGDVAAEDDDAVLSYFLKTDAVDQIESGSSFAVIGRKGSGKTALTKYFSQPRKEYVSSSPTLRDYPWNIHAKRRNLGASDIESYVSSWRYLIAVKANSVVIEQKGMKAMTDSQRAARDFLNDNYGGIAPSLAEILRPARLKVTKRIFSPEGENRRKILVTQTKRLRHCMSFRSLVTVRVSDQGEADGFFNTLIPMLAGIMLRRVLKFTQD